MRHQVPIQWWGQGGPLELFITPKTETPYEVPKRTHFFLTSWEIKRPAVSLLSCMGCFFNPLENKAASRSLLSCMGC